MNGVKFVILESHQHNIVPVPTSCTPGRIPTDPDCILAHFVTDRNNTSQSIILLTNLPFFLQPQSKSCSSHLAITMLKLKSRKENKVKAQCKQERRRKYIAQTNNNTNNTSQSIIQYLTDLSVYLPISASS